VRLQPVGLVFMVVVECEPLASGVEKFNKLSTAIEPRARTSAMICWPPWPQSGTRPVARTVDPPIDDSCSLTAWADCVVSFDSFSNIQAIRRPRTASRSRSRRFDDESGRMPGFFSLAFIVSVSVGKFQPSAARASPSRGPPNGKRP